MKKISILGSTGSVGTQCLEIISEFKNQFEIISLTAGKNEELLGDQIKKFKPSIIIVNIGGGTQEVLGYYLKKKLNHKCKLYVQGQRFPFLLKIKLQLMIL